MKVGDRVETTVGKKQGIVYEPYRNADYKGGPAWWVVFGEGDREPWSEVYLKVKFDGKVGDKVETNYPSSPSQSGRKGTIKAQPNPAVDIWHIWMDDRQRLETWHSAYLNVIPSGELDTKVGDTVKITKSGKDANRKGKLVSQVTLRTYDEWGVAMEDNGNIEYWEDRFLQVVAPTYSKEAEALQKIVARFVGDCSRYFLPREQFVLGVLAELKLVHLDDHCFVKDGPKPTSMSKDTFNLLVEGIAANALPQK